MQITNFLHFIWLLYFLLLPSFYLPFKPLKFKTLLHHLSCLHIFFSSFLYIFRCFQVVHIWFPNNDQLKVVWSIYIGKKVFLKQSLYLRNRHVKNGLYKITIFSLSSLIDLFESAISNSFLKTAYTKCFFFNCVFTSNSF